MYLVQDHHMEQICPAISRWIGQLPLRSSRREQSRGFNGHGERSRPITGERQRLAQLQKEARHISNNTLSPVFRVGVPDRHDPLGRGDSPTKIQTARLKQLDEWRGGLSPPPLSSTFIARCVLSKRPHVVHQYEHGRSRLSLVEGAVRQVPLT